MSIVKAVAGRHYRGLELFEMENFWAFGGHDYPTFTPPGVGEIAEWVDKFVDIFEEISDGLTAEQTEGVEKL